MKSGIQKLGQLRGLQFGSAGGWRKPKLPRADAKGSKHPRIRAPTGTQVRDYYRV